MEEQMKTRLAQLREEFEKGQAMLRETELKQAQLTETLVRISGAIQVLEELTGERPLEGTAANGDRAETAAAVEAP